eukprot:SAG31_NODE_3994_length_3679_cov_2.233240_2_plen_943_part_00
MKAKLPQKLLSIFDKFQDNELKRDAICFNDDTFYRGRVENALDLKSALERTGKAMYECKAITLQREELNNLNEEDLRKRACLDGIKESSAGRDALILAIVQNSERRQLADLLQIMLEEETVHMGTIKTVQTLGQWDPDVLPVAVLAARQYSARAAKEAAGNFHFELEAIHAFGVQQLALGHHSVAKMYLREVLRRRQNDKRFGPKHPDTLRSMHALGKLFLEMGNYYEAESLLTEACAGRQDVLGEIHSDTLDVQQTLGVLYRHQGKLKQGIPLVEKTLQALKYTQGDGHPNTLECQASLGALHRHQGNTVKALELLGNAVEKFSKELGDEDPRTLKAMLTLGLVHSHESNYVQALDILRKVHQTRRNLLGIEHPETLVAASRLGQVYQDQGRYTEARELFEETRMIQSRTLGDKHPRTLSGKDDYGSLLCDLGEYGKAEEILVYTLDARRDILGEEHPSTIHSIRSLAKLYMRTGDYLKAELLYVQAHTFVKHIHGDMHVETLLALRRLGLVELETRRFNSACDKINTAIEGLSTELGPQHQQTLSTMSALGTALFETGHLAKAEEILRTVYTFQVQALCGHHPDTLETQTKLGCLLKHMFKFVEAEKILNEAYELRKTHRGEQHPRTIICLMLRGQLYSEMGRDSNMAYNGVVDKSKWPEAEKLLSQACGLGEGYTPEKLAALRHTPETLAALACLGRHYIRARRFDKASKILGKVFDQQRDRLGEDHPHTIDTMVQLGAATVFVEGSQEQGYGQLERALELASRSYSPNNTKTLELKAKLARLYMLNHHYERARPLLEEVFEQRSKTFGDQHIWTAVAKSNLANLLLKIQPNDSDRIRAEQLQQEATQAMVSKSPSQYCYQPRSSRLSTAIEKVIYGLRACRCIEPHEKQEGGKQLMRKKMENYVERAGWYEAYSPSPRSTFVENRSLESTDERRTMRI